MNNKDSKRCKVGELRPSQALTTFGIGSIIDLPNLSVMVMSLEDWPLKDTVEIGEQRLLASVKEVLGHQVKWLRSAPVMPDTIQVNQFDASSLVGIPVAPFPRWMVCPYCRRLAPLGSGLFKLETPYRTDQIRYVHANCTKPGKSPTVVPARFIVACKNGHFDDFPWREFVHRGQTNCKGGLKLFELTATGEAAGIEVLCEGENCRASRRMSDAFKMDLNALPVCRGRRPHLRDHDEAGCKAPNGQDMRMEPMLQGASNSWFGIMLSALAIPQASGDLKQLVDDHWTILEKVQSEQNIELLQQVTPQLRDLSEYTPSEIWQAVQAKKTAMPTETTDPTDLKTPEWEVLTDPESAEKSRDFQLRVAAPPKRYAKYFEKIVLAERLREVRALVGFTRIESPSDYDNPTAFPASQRARLSRTQPTWVPASEIRGVMSAASRRRRPSPLTWPCRLCCLASHHRQMPCACRRTTPHNRSHASPSRGKPGGACGRKSWGDGDRTCRPLHPAYAPVTGTFKAFARTPSAPCPGARGISRRCPLRRKRRVPLLSSPDRLPHRYWS